MIHPRQRSFATSLLLLGLLTLLMSFSGGWGIAYGQTAGPTPVANQPAILNVTKEADNPSPRPRDTVVFVIRVSNVGGQPARNVQVVDAVPGEFEIVNVYATQGIPQINGQNVTVTIQQLDPGMMVVVTIETRVRATARGQLSNQVVVRAANLDGSPIAEERAQAVLGVADTADDPSASPSHAQGPGSQLSNTGADTPLYWPLFLLGLLLMMAGFVIFLRSRKTT